MDYDKFKATYLAEADKLLDLPQLADKDSIRTRDIFKSKNRTRQNSGAWFGKAPKLLWKSNYPEFFRIFKEKLDSIAKGQYKSVKSDYLNPDSKKVEVSRWKYDLDFDKDGNYLPVHKEPILKDTLDNEIKGIIVTMNDGNRFGLSPQFDVFDMMKSNKGNITKDRIVPKIEYIVWGEVHGNFQIIDKEHNTKDNHWIDMLNVLFDMIADDARGEFYDPNGKSAQKFADEHDELRDAVRGYLPGNYYDNSEFNKERRDKINTALAHDESTQGITLDAYVNDQRGLTNLKDPNRSTEELENYSLSGMLNNMSDAERDAFYDKVGTEFENKFGEDKIAEMSIEQRAEEINKIAERLADERTDLGKLNLLSDKEMGDYIRSKDPAHKVLKKENRTKKESLIDTISKIRKDMSKSKYAEDDDDDDFEIDDNALDGDWKINEELDFMQQLEMDNSDTDMFTTSNRLNNPDEIEQENDNIEDPDESEIDDKEIIENSEDKEMINRIHKIFAEGKSKADLNKERWPEFVRKDSQTEDMSIVDEKPIAEEIKEEKPAIVSTPVNLDISPKDIIKMFNILEISGAAGMQKLQQLKAFADQWKLEFTPETISDIVRIAND